MSGNRFGSRVSLVDSAVGVVERIVGTRETGAIGIVPLSVAGNAKVLPFAHATAPRLASIAAERYPLFVRVLASSDFRSPTGIVAGILDYARSTAARPTIGRTALAVPRRPTPYGAAQPSVREDLPAVATMPGLAPIRGSKGCISRSCGKRPIRR